MHVESLCNKTRGKEDTSDESFLIFIRSELHAIVIISTAFQLAALTSHPGTRHHSLLSVLPSFSHQNATGKRAGQSGVEAESVIRKRKWAEEGLPVEPTWQTLSTQLNLILKVSHQFTHTAGSSLCTFILSNSASGQRVQFRIYN